MQNKLLHVPKNRLQFHYANIIFFYFNFYNYFWQASYDTDIASQECE